MDIRAVLTGDNVWKRSSLGYTVH